MRWIIVCVVGGVVLFVWRMFEDHYKRRDRDELVGAIRAIVQEELITVRNRIIDEIRSASK
jgi:hypothetical protein